MSDKIKVLVFPCGSENASEVYQALRYSLHVELIGASSVEDFGRFRFEQYVGGLPNIRDAEFDAAFSSLVARLKVDIVFATHDSVLEYLAKRAAAMGFFLVNGDPATAAIVRRKTATYALFSDCDWAPRIFDSVKAIHEWPIIIKPDTGQGGQGVEVVRGPREATVAIASVTDPVLVEYLPGEEVTVDCFSDRDRKLIWVAPRSRDRVRAGITMRSEPRELTREIETIASTVNERLRLRGPWFFQLKKDGYGRSKLLEVSARVAGAMVAQRARGINLPLMALHDYMGRSLTTLPNRQVKLVERCIATRAWLDFEYDTVFVDLDDTLVVNGFANHTVLAFLYQSIRDGKSIKLITRHAMDVGRTLQTARIAWELFDEIIQLKVGEPKAGYVTSRSIFIDNHFPERVEVSRRTGVPVFDVDALEFFVR